MEHDISKLYDLRGNFTIIGLTGRSGSGVSTVARKIADGFGDGKDFADPYSFDLNDNSYRKYRIVHAFASQNFSEFKLVKYCDVLLLFILKFGFDNLIKFLRSHALDQEFENAQLMIECDFEIEIKELLSIRKTFDEYSNKLTAIDLESSGETTELYDIFFSGDFFDFAKAFTSCLSAVSKIKRNKVLQVVANNLRRVGQPFESVGFDSNKIFTIVEVIKGLIKAHRKKNKTKTQFVIDSFRNPIEIMFFKQRFAAFYIISINRKDQSRENSLSDKYKGDYNSALRLFSEEYNGAKDHEFYKQKVADCIQHADIHITFLNYREVKELNDAINKRKIANEHDNTTPYFSWQMQLLKYISLIAQPGIVPPTPEERCMQIAFTAKYNSGCISRQVGAAITDEYYSVKAIGWNNTPEGQVPCVLRNVEDLLDPGINDLPDRKKDLQAFTPYERNTDTPFYRALQIFYGDLEGKKEKLKGRNVCFCFKSVQNSCEGKNQVHTRSLHAEESAFLQITKYGGTGIKGGKLFSTASPCELCSKKAYQLGIRVIYYIDPYPGISKDHILEAGINKPKLRLFNGAIGNAYHWLYEPFMAYKDELSLILDHKIQDKTSQLEDEISILREAHEKEIYELETRAAEQELEITRLKELLNSRD